MTVHGPSLIRSGALAALLALGACAGPGSGQDTVDPAQIRIITPTEATSTCIGQRTTPLCAIESTVGCSNYIWNRTCGYKDIPIYAELRANKSRVEYVIVKSGFVNPAKVHAVEEEERKKDPGHYLFLLRGAFQAHVLDRACPEAWPDCGGVPWRVGLFSVVPDRASPGSWTPAFVEDYRSGAWYVD
jgi:hypothetical protein